MSRWVVVRVSRNGAHNGYFASERGSWRWPTTTSEATLFDTKRDAVAAQTTLRAFGFYTRAINLDAHAGLAADPPTQPAHANGEPTAQGTR